MLKKIILSILLVSSYNLSFSQDKIEKTIKKDAIQIENINKIDKEFTLEQIQNMDKIIQANDYPLFYEYMKKINVSGKKYISYLQSKRDEGHIPLYWLMADYYSKQVGKEEDTHIWYYIAIIMTEQDSYLCYDKSSRYATEKLTRSFIKPLDVVRKTPQFTKTSMSQSIFFITNLKHRINPKWVCLFGDSPFPETHDILIPSIQWDRERNIIFKKFTKDYLN